jgi:hypothetical protein
LTRRLTQSRHSGDEKRKILTGVRTQSREQT